jgi:predicted dienelactone hydrolase
MRPFEILLALSVLLSLLRFALRNPPRWMKFAPTFGLALLGLHLVFEGYRWQMVGLYALALILFLFSLPRLLRPARQAQSAGGPGWLAWLWSGLAALLTLLFAAPAFLFPIPHLPTPGGPYPVGTFTRMLVDDSRREIYSANPDEPRRFLIQVWYPAASVAGLKMVPWMPEAKLVAPAIAAWLDLPGFSLDHLQYARIPSYSNAPLAQAESAYPLLLFSHGWSGFRTQSSSLMHELASYGYVVAALEYPYASILTVFPDGTVAKHNPQILPSGVSDEEYQRAAQRLVDQWTNDLTFALNTLESMNLPGGEFAGRLDLQRVGIFGHSTGGGATVEFCYRDLRCKAGLGLDTWMTPVSPQTRTGGVSQPFLFLFSELWSTETNKALFTELQLHSPQAQSLTIQGTAHLDFTDLPLLTPLAAQLKLKGPLEGHRVLKIINTDARAFFDQTLKGIPSPLLEKPSEEFPEVH